jgi:hypothetical protein
MFLFFSVARSQEIGSWERASETAQSAAAQTGAAAPAAPAPKPAAKPVPKNGTNPNFGMNMPMMCSAFDTAAWLNAA